MPSIAIQRLTEDIERLYELGPDADREESREVFTQLRSALSTGRVRAAEPDVSSDTGWTVNSWVKKGILVGFRCGDIVSYTSTSSSSPYLDKDTLPLKAVSQAENIRVVPGLSLIHI